MQVTVTCPSELANRVAVGRRDLVHAVSCAGGLMPRSMVGLLAAIGAALSALVAYTHGARTWATIADAAIATGLAAYAAAPQKK